MSDPQATRQLRRLGGKLLRTCAAAGAALVSPALIAPLLLLGGAAALVYGLFLLAGLGWSVIAGGLLAMAAGIVLIRGVNHG